MADCKSCMKFLQAKFTSKCSSIWSIKYLHIIAENTFNKHQIWAFCRHFTQHRCVFWHSEHVCSVTHHFLHDWKKRVQISQSENYRLLFSSHWHKNSQFRGSLRQWRHLIPSNWPSKEDPNGRQDWGKYGRGETERQPSQPSCSENWERNRRACVLIVQELKKWTRHPFLSRSARGVPKD